MTITNQTRLTAQTQRSVEAEITKVADEKRVSRVTAAKLIQSKQS